LIADGQRGAQQRILEYRIGQLVGVAVTGQQTQGTEMVFDVGRNFVLAFGARFASFEIGACDDVKVLLQVFCSDVVDCINRRSR
jgi:hypothetical protein